ncbi:glycine oxidase ThiO [Mammaliicoccus sp. Dog046]|uniref:glycine oxidase ThiO n=1 Tax=Mammaliicoccus sp. Dog046 TaxID=3034233 RepID=UPI002B25950A|nr:glycine oxidase ThiO [Mammaliicoccus sp. Dog046]WQK85775.1 glycine oxidase ThiO [Mammaliicoccus sp. Dog046]
MYDVLIVGSGVIGMSIARDLHEHDDLSIAVIDRDVPGLHASYKAGGMLGAQNEFTENTDLFQLALQSRRKFKTLSHELYEETGIDIHYQSEGLIKMAAAQDDTDNLNMQWNFLNTHDKDVVRLDKQSLAQLSNSNITYHNHAIYIPRDGQINASQYTKALLKSIEQKDIHRFYQTEVSSLERVQDIYRVQTSKGTLTAKKVIVAAGAWSDQLLQDYNISTEITGIKGEVLLLEQPQLDLKQTLFMTNGCYIVPKYHNRFLVGATSYKDDFSVGTTAKGEDWLFNEATTYIPSLVNSKVIHKWSGIRPFTLNEWPIMDEIDNGLFLVTGHYRNGILLSPIIGELVSDWIRNQQRPSLLNHFKTERSSYYEMHH